VGVRAPVDGDVEHTGKRDVGDVATAARDEPPVLAPPHAGAEKPFAHFFVPMGVDLSRGDRL